MVVHVTTIEENRTQQIVLNYCAQAKAVLKCVQKAGLACLKKSYTEAEEELPSF
jgi:hypothetical protein